MSPIILVTVYYGRLLAVMTISGNFSRRKEVCHATLSSRGRLAIPENETYGTEFR